MSNVHGRSSSTGDQQGARAGHGSGDRLHEFHRVQMIPRQRGSKMKSRWPGRQRRGTRIKRHFQTPHLWPPSFTKTVPCPRTLQAPWESGGLDRQGQPGQTGRAPPQLCDCGPASRPPPASVFSSVKQMLIVFTWVGNGIRRWHVTGTPMLFLVLFFPFHRYFKRLC